MKKVFTINRTPLIIGFLLTLFFFAGCVQEDYFGKSSYKQIRYISFSEEVGVSRIVEDSLRIYAKVSSGNGLESVKIDSVQLSSFASMSPPSGSVLDFSSPVILTVTAEDGSLAAYTVIVKEEISTPQLENSNFDTWHTPPGKNYQEPGLDEFSIWASANAGVTTTGANNFNTMPILVTGTNYAAKLVTKDLGVIAQITGQRMGSATLFTGEFDLNLANPAASAKFGIPFVARPIAFEVEAKYTAGTPYKNGNNEVLNKTDTADIYILLENRENPNAIKRIATAWVRLGDTPGTETMSVNKLFHYGPLPPDAPPYEMPANGLFGNANEAITHITVVFASSSNGINYEGGVNSTLIIDNLRLIY